MTCAGLVALVSEVTCIVSYSCYCCQCFLVAQARESTSNIASTLRKYVSSFRRFHSLLEHLNRIYSEYSCDEPLI